MIYDFLIFEVCVSFLFILFVYMIFVEPNWIITRSEKFVYLNGILNVKLALISDIHLGRFKGINYLKRVLKLILKQKPDLIVIAGDLINNPTSKQLSEMFMPFKDVSIPIYVVLGNHDIECSGRFSREEVQAALPVNVNVIDNSKVIFRKQGRELCLFGLSDFLEGKADYLLTKARFGQCNLIVTHNPDSACELKKLERDDERVGLDSNVNKNKLPISRTNRLCNGLSRDLMVAGHTHGGQIFIPPFVYFFIPCKRLFLRGWYEVDGLPLYITSGIGEIALPMRFLVPPEIVLMDLYI